MSAQLPADIAKCHGVMLQGEWREGCEDCRRRTSPPHAGRQAWIVAPPLKFNECERRIEPVLLAVVSSTAGVTAAGVRAGGGGAGVPPESEAGGVPAHQHAAARGFLLDDVEQGVD